MFMLLTHLTCLNVWSTWPTFNLDSLEKEEVDLNGISLQVLAVPLGMLRLLITIETEYHTFFFKFPTERV